MHRRSESQPHRESRSRRSSQFNRPQAESDHNHSDAELDDVFDSESEAPLGVGSSASVTNDQRMVMKSARDLYNLDTKVEALRTECTSLKGTFDMSLSAIQSSVAQISKKVLGMEKKWRAGGEGDGELLPTSEKAKEYLRNTLQPLKDSTFWFYGRVLPNSRGFVELWPARGSGGPALPQEGEKVRIPCGTWLRLGYPMRKANDEGGKSFVFIRSQLIDPDSASITNHWVKSYDLTNNVPYLGEYTFLVPHMPPPAHDVMVGREDEEVEEVRKPQERVKKGKKGTGASGATEVVSVVKIPRVNQSQQQQQQPGNEQETPTYAARQPNPAASNAVETEDEDEEEDEDEDGEERVSHLFKVKGK